MNNEIEGDNISLLFNESIRNCNSNECEMISQKNIPIITCVNGKESQSKYIYYNLLKFKKKRCYIYRAIFTGTPSMPLRRAPAF